MNAPAMLPPDAAELYKRSAGKKYRPSNGTEGLIFFDHWCSNCQRDKSMREGEPVEECDDNELCQIIALTHAHDIDDPEYPAEWIINSDGQPCCTAFIEAGKPIPEARCEHTADLFGGVE